MAIEFVSYEYKRGFITGMAMNPLFVTTETAPALPAESSEIISAEETGLYFGVLNNVIKVIIET